MPMNYLRLLILFLISLAGIACHSRISTADMSECSVPPGSGDGKEMKVPDSFKQFLREFMSEEYIRAHFRFLYSYAPSDGPVTLSYVLTFSGIQARTRTSGEQNGAFISGLARISPDGKIQSYFGPVKEYEIKIGSDKAESIMRQKGCVFEENSLGQSPAGSPPKRTDRIELYIGDYFEEDGKYSPDYIPEGFYWVGGRPMDGEVGSYCLVDAETGKFSIRSFAPH